MDAPSAAIANVVVVHVLQSCLLFKPPALSGTLVEHKKDKLHSIHDFVNFGETCCEEAATLLEHLVFELDKAGPWLFVLDGLPLGDGDMPGLKHMLLALFCLTEALHTKSCQANV